MHLYGDISLEDTLNFAPEAQKWLNLQWGELGLENPLVSLVVTKDLAYYMPQRYDPAHHN